METGSVAIINLKDNKQTYLLGDAAVSGHVGLDPTPRIKLATTS